ncbi:glucuronate isomerase, partial [Candidatus Saccharibacteria bacterium]|nr:glucuronate isomerase [Candidatus Saccharibacteria bacterium]
MSPRALLAVMCIEFNHFSEMSLMYLFKSSELCGLGAEDFASTNIASINFMVCPSYRPDKAINIQKEGFFDYIKKLAKVVGKEDLESCSEVCAALNDRVDYFKAHGARATDHGIDYVPFKL